MRYDGLGRRIELVHAGVTRRYVYAGGDLLAARDEAGALTSWVTRAGGELIAEWTAAGVREAVLDHMGSRVGWYAADIRHKTPRDSFGRGVADIGPSGPDVDALTWHAQDPTGLVYMQARYYDPEVGRFLSEDPVQATNRYAYAFNNPVVRAPLRARCTRSGAR
jgi:hypothetical protein